MSHNDHECQQEPQPGEQLAASGGQVGTAPSALVRPLSQLIGKAKGCYEDAAAVDQFTGAGRDEWAR